MQVAGHGGGPQRCLPPRVLLVNIRSQLHQLGERVFVATPGSHVQRTRTVGVDGGHGGASTHLRMDP